MTRRLMIHFVSILTMIKKKFVFYQYYGGTNYGRTSSSFVTTRYYDEAPLDEFGLEFYSSISIDPMK